MEKVKTLVTGASQAISKQAPTILIAVGIGGSITAAVMACTETPKAIKLLEEKKKEVDRDLKTWEKVVTVAPAYWPAFLVECGAITCLIFSNNISLKRQAAALAAYSISEGKLKDYKEAVTKTVGGKKAKEVDSKVAEEEIKRNPPNPNNFIFTGNGDVLCYDSVSGRYFKSSIEKVKQAVNDLNQIILIEGDVTLNEFYDRLGLSDIKLGDELGWSYRHTGNLIDITFTSKLTSDNEPCLVLDYEVEPGYWGAY